MFPELRERFGSLFRETKLTTLDLKSAPGTGADWYARNGFNNLGALHEYGASWSGKSVTVDTAQNHSVVWACERIISESIAFMPLAMMQQTSRGKFPANGVDVPAHPMYLALHNAPNDEMTAMGFRETETGHLVMGGNCFGRIMRRSGTGVANELYPLLPSQVTPDRDREKRLVYVVKDGNAQSTTYTVERGRPHDILHIRGLGNDGVRGYSVIAMARHSIGTAIATEHNVARFFARGGRLPYVLQMEGRFKTEQDFKQFRADWEETYEDPHKAPILEPPIKSYQPIGLSARDAQLLEARQFEIPEICRWFLISPHLVGDLSRATFSNIEHLALQFVKFTLTAWTTRWEQELWRCILTPEEKRQGYYFKHNVDGLLRGDFQTRMAGYASALQNGHLSINEVRDLQDLNPVEGGNQHFVQLNLQELTALGEPAATRVPVAGRKPQAAA